MSDIPITTASFNQAYRGYAVEMGHDQAVAQTRLAEATEQSIGAQGTARVANDALYISPEAARLYAEQTVRQKLVERKPESHAANGADSATAQSGADETSATGDSAPHTTDSSERR